MATTPNLGADGGSSSFCNCKRTLRKSAGKHALSARTQAVDVQAKRSAGLQVVVFSIVLTVAVLRPFRALASLATI